MSRKLLRWRRQALEKHEKMVAGDLEYQDMSAELDYGTGTGLVLLYDDKGHFLRRATAAEVSDLADGKKRYDQVKYGAPWRVNDPTQIIRETKPTDMSDPKNHIVEGLPKAIREAKRIARRPDQKADRKERVGIFVTCLRRRLVMMKNQDAYNLLVDTKLWYDIGVLAESCTLRAGTHKVALSELRSWLAEAQLVSSVEPFDIDDIDAELAELRHEIYGMEQINLQMERINHHAESVSEQIVACFQE